MTRETAARIWSAAYEAARDAGAHPGAAARAGEAAVTAERSRRRKAAAERRARSAYWAASAARAIADRWLAAGRDRPVI